MKIPCNMLTYLLSKYDFHKKKNLNCEERNEEITRVLHCYIRRQTLTNYIIY